MPLISWLPFALAQQPPDQADTTHKTKESEAAEGDSNSDSAMPSFDDIVSRFNDLNNEVVRLQRETEDQQRQIKDYLARIENDRIQHQKQTKIHETQIKDLRRQLNQEKQHTESLQLAIADKRNVTALRQQGPVKGFKQVLQNERATGKSQNLELENKFGRSQQDNTILRGQVKQLTSRIEELKLDIEFLKCTASQPTAVEPALLSMNSDIVPLTEIPFVLVLVDGDAYRFAEMLPNPYLEPQMHPAARMAQNIKMHLQTYIVSHGLPLHCKLMVRVLANGAGLKNGKPFGYHQRNTKAAEAIEDFMVRFTEFAPMFEFFDAGSGKERVDSKIHELYHTFLPNPACHKIFLATARDNGFARMIEQDIHHPAARAKTCLIVAGDTAAEIERLNLETVEWSSVFARQFQPKEVVGRNAKREHRRLREEADTKKNRDLLIKQLGMQGYKDLMERQSFQLLTKELMGHRTVETIVQDLFGMDKRRSGVRIEMSLKRQASLEAVVDNLDLSHHDRHWCTEVGVD